MKKKDIIEGKIIKTEFPNKGTFICEDQKVTVKGVIDGQTIKGQVTKKRKSGCVVRLLDVLEKSPLEDAKPVCPHFGICGGCFYQTVSYENQLKIKEGMVRDLLKDYVTDDIWEEIKGSPKPWGYRNKMEFSFGDEVKDGPLALGMHKKNTFHDIVNITDCKIVDNDYNLIVKCALSEAQKMELPFYHKMRHEGYFRHLVVRRAESSGDILVNIVTTSQAEADLNNLRDALLELPLNGKIIGILHTINDSLADVVQADKIDVLYGQDYFYEEILGLKWDCVFLNEKTPYISVRRAWHVEGGEPVVNTLLKTPAAKRDVPIPKCLVACLKEAREKSESEYVISNSKGTVLTEAQFVRVWKYITVRSTAERCYYTYVNGQSIKHRIKPRLGEHQPNNPKLVYTMDFKVTPHMLRHTYITNLIYKGVDPKTVQYLAGHENSKTTMDIYAKVKYNKPEKLSSVVNAAFGLR